MLTQKPYQHLAALCTFLAAMAVLPAWSQAPVFTISQSTSGTTTTFTVRRDDTSAYQRIECHTVSLSAIAGEHFTVPNGVLTFSAGEKEKTVTVVEKAPTDIDELYRYQNGTSRAYRFVVCNNSGFVLASADHTITYGNDYQVNNNYVNQEIRNLIYFSGSNYASDTGKYVDIPYDPASNSQHKRSGSYVRVTDKDLYGDATLCNIPTAKLFSTAGIPQSYTTAIGNKMYAAVAFTMKEAYDGYQYMQILTDDRDSYDGTDPDGDVALPVYARYKACFELSKTSPSVVTDDHKMFFPHRYNSNSGSNEFEYSDSYLYKQLFRDDDERPFNCGALILSPSVNEINVRFDARGKDDDDWYFKNLFVRLALLDDNAPTLIDQPYASPGIYHNETDFYISVPFSEIVTVTGTGTPTLYTSWGTASYCAGEGTNVLTFKGTINAAKETHLEINGINLGNNIKIKDLAGNEFTGSLTYDGFPDDIKVLLSNPSLDNWSTQIIGLESEYPFFGEPVEPRPTAIYFYKGTWTEANRKTLVEGTDYTLMWYNNTQPGTAQIIITAKGNYSSSVSRSFNLRGISYTVHFDTNGGEGTMDDQAFTYGTTQRLTANTFTRNGYTFDGWSTTPEGEAVYHDKQQVNNLTTTDGGTVTLYAQWTPITYNITYNLNGGTWPGGTLKPENYTVLSGGNIRTAPVREGYSFAGWTGTGLDTLTFNIVIPIGSMGDRTYTAHWSDPWGVIDIDDGTEEHPYVITTTEGLDLLAERVIAGNDYSGTYFVLGADIEYDSWKYSNYTPIGTESHHFSGTFDGQNHTVSGIRIDNRENDNQGLFGYVEAGAIRNVILADTRIKASHCVGGIAGYYNRETTIENCHVTQDVFIQGEYYCGGIVGNNDNINAEIISGCTSAATISGDGCCGGIVGRNEAAVSNCLAIDVTLPTYTIVTGAIVGENNDGTLSHNFYHGGKRKGCGGEQEDVDILGQAEPGYFITLEEDVDMAVVEGDLTTFTIPAHKELNEEGILTAVPAKTYTVASPGTIITLAYSGTVQEGYKPVFHVTLSDGGSLENNPDIFPMDFGDITVGVALADNRWGIADGADGTKEHPYVITTTYELDLLAERVNAGNSYEDKYFVLGADIAYSHTSEWDADSSTENNFTCIGTGFYGFRGTLDGRGHTVSGIRICSTDGFQGLFGCIYDEGTVRNVTLADARFTGEQSVGGIAGVNYGTIENCCVAADVFIGSTSERSGYHGGIVGYNYSGTVSNCRAVGAKLYDSSDVGAIVGHNGGTLSHNYYYDCSIIKSELYPETEGIGTGDGGDVIEDDGAVLTEGVPLLTTCSNDYVLDLCKKKGYKDFTLIGSSSENALSQPTTWDFFCLPFYVQRDDFPSERGIIYNFDCGRTNVSNDTLTVYFSVSSSTPGPGYPFGYNWGYKMEADTTWKVTFKDKNLDYPSGPLSVTSDDGAVTFRGSNNPVSITAPQGTYLYNPSDDTFCMPGETLNVKAFTPWFEVKSDVAIKAITIQMEGYDEVTISVPLGDVNGDGRVTPADAIMILYHYFNVQQQGFNKSAADINKDKNITPADAIEALYKFFGTNQNHAPRRVQPAQEPQ